MWRREGDTAAARSPNGMTDQAPQGGGKPASPTKPRFLPEFIWRIALRSVGAPEPKGGEVGDGLVTGLMLDDALGVPGAALGLLARMRRKRRERGAAADLPEGDSPSRPGAVADPPGDSPSQPS